MRREDPGFSSAPHAHSGRSARDISFDGKTCDDVHASVVVAVPGSASSSTVALHRHPAK